MKTRLFTLFFLSIVWTSFCQTASINVALKLPCDEIFETEAFVLLYNADELTLLGAKNTNPCTFEGLNPNADYVVKVSTYEKSPSQVKWKDIVAIQNHLLGINKLTNVQASVVDMGGLVTTVDIVMAARYIVEKPDSLLQWLFYSDAFLANPASFYYLDINKSKVTNFLNNVANVSFTAFHQWETHLSDPSYCSENCTDKDEPVYVYYNDKQLVKNALDTIDFYFSNPKKMVGNIAHLTSDDDVEIINVLDDQDRPSSFSSTYNMLTTFIGTSNTTKNLLCRAVIRSKIDQALSASSLTIDPNAYNVIVLKENQCLVEYPIVFSLSSSTGDLPTTDFVVYPNPVMNKAIYFKLEDSVLQQLFTIKIYNNIGQEVLTQSATGKQLVTEGIAISNFTAGTYLVKLQHLQKQFPSKKLVVIP